MSHDTDHDQTPHGPLEGGDDPIVADDDTVARATGVPSDNTSLTAVLGGLEASGFDGHIVPEPGGNLRCTACGVASPAAEYWVESIRRLEGASDPDEMMSVIAARCPQCDRAGVAVLGYGPSASADDADVSVALVRPAP